MKILTSVSDKNVNTNNSGFTINKKEMVTSFIYCHSITTKDTFSPQTLHVKVIWNIKCYDCIKRKQTT